MGFEHLRTLLLRKHMIKRNQQESGFNFTEWDEQTLNIRNASRQVKEVLFLSET